MKRPTSPRKLPLRAETIAVLRQLSRHDLRDARVAGASGAGDCDESTLSDPSYVASFCC